VVALVAVAGVLGSDRIGRRAGGLGRTCYLLVADWAASCARGFAHVELDLTGRHRLISGSTGQAGSRRPEPKAKRCSMSRRVTGNAPPPIYHKA
jgi:hypothetical protein